MDELDLRNTAEIGGSEKIRQKDTASESIFHILYTLCKKTNKPPSTLSSSPSKSSFLSSSRPRNSYGHTPLLKHMLISVLPPKVAHFQ